MSMAMLAQANTVSKHSRYCQRYNRQSWFKMSSFDETWHTQLAFVAFTMVELANVKSVGVLKPSVFEHTPYPGFFKLSLSRDAAVDAALRAFTGNATNAATEITVWFVLTLKFTPHQWIQLMLNNDAPTQIVRTRWSTLQVTGELSLHDIQQDYNMIVLEPIGLPAWAEKRLSLHQQRGDETCGDCGKCHTTVWLARKWEPKGERYCAECWHKYCMSKFP